MFELQLIDAPGAGAALVPVPVLGRAVLFVGADGRIRARLADGSFVLAAVGQQGDQGLPGRNGFNGLPGTNGTNGSNGLPGAKGEPGTNGTNGLPGSKGDPGEVVSLHTSTLGQSRAGVAAGLLLHEYTFNQSLVGRMVRARGLLSVLSAASSVNVSALLNIGGLVCEFSPFAITGSRLIRFDLDMHVQAAAQAQGGGYQGTSALNAAMAMIYAQRLSLANAVTNQTVQFSIKGSLSAVTVLAASIEVL